MTGNKSVEHKINSLQMKNIHSKQIFLTKLKLALTLTKTQLMNTVSMLARFLVEQITWLLLHYYAYLGTLKHKNYSGNSQTYLLNV